MLTLLLVLASRTLGAQAVLPPAAPPELRLLETPAVGVEVPVPGPLACYAASRDLTQYPPLLCAGAASVAPSACFAAAKPVTQYPALLCSGARSKAPVECFGRARTETNFPALLCAGATSDEPLECWTKAKGTTPNPDLLCSPNGALKALTHDRIDPSYNLPYPFPFNHPYPFRFPFPDPSRDPTERKP